MLVRRPKTRRLAMLLVLVLVGVGVLAYAAATVLWRDPLTAL